MTQASPVPQTVVINGRRLSWAQEHYPGFWDNVARGAWEPQTYRAVDRHVTPDTVVVDIGANIGAITLYAAERAARVISFEPDPLSYAMLLANIDANPALAGRITPIAKAVHASKTPIRFGSQRSGGDSMSSAVLPDLETVWTVETVTPDQLDGMLPPRHIPVFVKMDIEAGEYDLVPAAAALWRRPNLTLLLSTHQSVLTRFTPGTAIRRRTRRLFAALRDYEVGLNRHHGVERRIGLSLLHRFGLAAPLSGEDWLFTRRVLRTGRTSPACRP